MKQEPSPHHNGNSSPADPVIVRIVLVIHEVSRTRNTTMGPSPIRPGIENPRYDRAQGVTNDPGLSAPAPGSSTFPPASSPSQGATSGPAAGSHPQANPDPNADPHPAPHPLLEGALDRSHLQALLRRKQALDAAKASAVDNEADIEIVLVLYV